MHPCIHLTFVFYDHKSSKSLDLVSIWSFDEFSSLCLRFLTIKRISHLTMVGYHQNSIRRTLGLTITKDITRYNYWVLETSCVSPLFVSLPYHEPFNSIGYLPFFFTSLSTLHSLYKPIFIS